VSRFRLGNEFYDTGEAEKTLMELVDRAIPMKIEVDYLGTSICPKCGTRGEAPNFCNKCGQALEWGGEE